MPNSKVLHQINRAIEVAAQAQSFTVTGWGCLAIALVETKLKKDGDPLAKVLCEEFVRIRRAHALLHNVQKNLRQIGRNVEREGNVRAENSTESEANRRDLADRKIDVRPRVRNKR